MKILNFKAPDTIRSRTILLLIGIAVLVTGVSVSTILARPPLREAPLQTFEIARLLRGQPIAKPNSNVSVTTLASEPSFSPQTRTDRIAELALARDLGRPVGDVRFQGTGQLPRHLSFLAAETERALHLYGPNNIEVAVPLGFNAAVKLPDGRWRTVWRKSQDELADWRTRVIIRFVISLALMLPIGWLFARWLTEPIQALGVAAERLGRRRRVEDVDVRGPAEIRQVAEALNEMQARIRGYVLERTSVVGAIAHDLRTPLSRLKFQLALAPDAIRSKAECEIDEMEQMIAATLAFAEAEARPLVKERLDLGLLVEGVVDDLSDSGQPVFLVQCDDATLAGDPLMLKRMLTNLINNAITYGKRALVSMKRENRRVVVEIDDEGPGLDPESLARAFEPFYRVEQSRNRATGGIGLGLAIVKAAATSHGGDVELVNRPEGGLRARLWLPLD